MTTEPPDVIPVVCAVCGPVTTRPVNTHPDIGSPNAYAESALLAHWINHHERYQGASAA